MTPLHLLAALGIVAIWGVNFVAIRLGIQGIPPIFLCVMRFILAAFPAVFFIRRPAVPFIKIVQYGLVIFALQFAFLYSGMFFGVSAGLASLALQVQVFVTIGLALIVLKDRPTVFQMVGAVIAFLGIALIAMHIGGDVSASGLVCVLLAALAWGGGNIVSKTIGKVDMLALVVWGSLVAIPPLLVLSLVAEGPARIVHSLENLHWVALASVAYQAYLSTLFGYAMWSWLLSRYPAATVAPLSLLVPVVGMASSALVLGEQLQPWKIGAAVLIMAGLCINVVGPRLMLRFARPAQ
jgi:O-acetylserine/cysteine efflux transporter